MSKVQANGITINYEQQGTGEPLVLIPYLAADHACYAFQVADYAKHFTCVSLDPRGAGESDKPDGTYSMELRFHGPLPEDRCGGCRVAGPVPDGLPPMLGRDFYFGNPEDALVRYHADASERCVPCP